MTLNSGTSKCARPGPKRAMRTASSTAAATVPAHAERQPRTAPTASTMVSASTNSTSDARKAAKTVGHANVMASLYPACPLPTAVTQKRGRAAEATR